MPTVFSHAIIGVAAAAVLPDQRHPERLYGLSILCSVIPDADVVAFVFDVPYAHAFGHRGFFHSLFVALVLAILVVFIFFREEKVFSRPWWLWSIYFFLLTASHGILDTFTSGGLGIALLAPFDNTRYLSPVTFFEAAPLDFKALFTPWGLRVLKTEFLGLWIPALFFIFWARYRRAVQE
jgi:inner membrane protein